MHVTAISNFLKSQEDILTAHAIKKALDLNLSINSGVRTYVCGVESSFDFKDTFKFP
jgi:NADH:ubiquinone oxidoreductase subunit F (NADH-binding)